MKVVYNANYYQNPLKKFTFSKKLTEKMLITFMKNLYFLKVVV